MDGLHHIYCRDQCRILLFDIPDSIEVGYTMARGHLSVSPSARLGEGQTVTLTGRRIMASYSGPPIEAAPTGQWTAYQCAHAVVRDTSLAGVARNCVAAPATVTVPASGDVTVDMAVHRTIQPPAGPGGRLHPLGRGPAGWCSTGWSRTGRRPSIRPRSASSPCSDERSYKRLVEQAATATVRTRPSADETRERILAAALDVFSDRGFDGASTREIAPGGRDPAVAQLPLHVQDRAVAGGGRRVFAALGRAMGAHAEGLRGVDALTVARLLVREFVAFSARHPQLHRIITQESKLDGPRMDWLVERHVRPLYHAATAQFAALAEQGHMPAIPPAHLYYILTGAGATMFVLGPECRRLSGLDPASDEVIEAHADAVCLLLFGR